MKKYKKQKTHKKFSVTMLFFAVFLFFAYSSAIASATLSITDMQEKNIEIQDLETEIAELEFEYFEIMNAINQHDAQVYGLAEVTDVSYASLDAEISVAYND